MQTQLVNLDATTNSQSKIQNSSKGSQTKTVSSFEKKDSLGGQSGI